MMKSILRLSVQWFIVFSLLASRIAGPAYAQSPSDATFVATLGELRGASFADKDAIVQKLAQSGHPNVRAALTALQEDRLYFRNDDQKVFLVKTAATGDATSFDLIDPLSLKSAGTVSTDNLTKIGTNNHLRRVLQTTMARFGLSSPDPSVRLEAALNIQQELDESDVQLLRERSAVETNFKVKKEIDTGLALAALDSSDQQARLAAISKLRGNIRQDVRNKLEPLTEKSEDGTYIESDENVRLAATAAVKSIDRWRSIYSGVQTLFFGLSLGSVLVLIAIGLAITFGVMGVINMAHGELMMLGAYTTYLVQTVMPNHTEISILVAIPAAFIVAALMGILIERTIIRFLYGRPLETLLATFGVSLILQQLVRSIFTALNRSVITPQWMSGTMQVNDALSITYNRLFIVIFTVIVFAGLLAILKRTRVGLQIRAVSQNRAMAKAMGIRSEWVDAMTFGLGSGIAGVAGVALSQLTNVNPNLGQSYIIDSFMVVVFGGVGNLWGAMVGGMSMGVVNQLLEPYSGAVLAKILVLIALILFIQRRPRGLFPPTGRASDNQ
ncbi:MAG TPA: urea ABC transporter permease subunit UrtB [Candidatus Acidoferrales bacterium]|jgi:urea transport system permease protein|nr:urea ABC transporter permease subunit UrtB [Candidatus Acidoferrales bacterium]